MYPPEAWLHRYVARMRRAVHECMEVARTRRAVAWLHGDVARMHRTVARLHGGVAGARRAAACLHRHMTACSCMHALTHAHMRMWPLVRMHERLHAIECSAACGQYEMRTLESKCAHWIANAHAQAWTI
eukprot:366319-Chlamydomonas_euryale.AAC.6